MKQLFSKWFGAGRKSSGGSVLIKDHKSHSEQGSSSDVVPLRGSGDGSGQSVARKKDPAERFTESVDKLVSKLEGINDNLGRQTSQNEQLVQTLEQLPKTLSSVPTAIGRQQETLTQMVEQLRRKIEKDEALSQTLSRLPEQAGRQTESLEAIEDKLTSSADMDARMAETFTKVSESLSKLDADVAGEIEWLQKMSRSFADNEMYLKETLIAQQRRFFRIFMIAVGVSLVAITGLVIVLVLLLHR